MSDIRTKLSELTSNIHSQVELDAFVSKNGGLATLIKSQFPGSDVSEFLYEWESIKLSIKKMTTDH